MATEDTPIGIRISKSLHERIVTEQERIKKREGIDPSFSDVIRMLLEKGLEANGKRK